MVTSENDSQIHALAKRVEVRSNDGGHFHEAAPNRLARSLVNAEEISRTAPRASGLEQLLTSNSSTRRDSKYATGEVSERDLRVACKDRREVICPACSYLYRADTWILVSTGLVGGKGTPAVVGTHPRLFVTLTAPSFSGAVHTIRDGRRLRRPKRNDKVTVSPPSLHVVRTSTSSTATPPWADLCARNASTIAVLSNGTGTHQDCGTTQSNSSVVYWLRREAWDNPT